jgi:hypothetical protein
MRYWIYALNEYSSAIVDPVPDCVESRREDPMASPHHENLPEDGLEDELRANLGIHLRSTD